MAKAWLAELTINSIWPQNIVVASKKCWFDRENVCSVFLLYVCIQISLAGCTYLFIMYTFSRTYMYVDVFFYMYVHRFMFAYVYKSVFAYD